MTSERILVVDDEVSVRELLRSFLKDIGYTVSAVGSAEEALKVLVDEDIDIVLCDIILPGLDGMHLLNEIKHAMPDIEVIMITGHGTMETSVEAVSMGAYDYLLKPFEDIDDISFTVGRAAEKRRLSVNNDKLLHDHKRQKEMATKCLKRLSSLLNALKKVRSNVPDMEFLAHISDLIGREMNVDETAIFLIDEKGEALTIAAYHGIDYEKKRNFSIEMGDGIPGRVAQTGTPYFLQSKNAARELHAPFPIAACVPIMKGDRPIGVIAVTDRTSGELYNDQDLDFLLGVADLASMALKETESSSAEDF